MRVRGRVVDTDKGLLTLTQHISGVSSEGSTTGLQSAAQTARHDFTTRNDSRVFFIFHSPVLPPSDLLLSQLQDHQYPAGAYTIPCDRSHALLSSLTARKTCPPAHEARRYACQAPLYTDSVNCASDVHYLRPCLRPPKLCPLPATGIRARCPTYIFPPSSTRTSFISSQHARMATPCCATA